MSPGVLVENQGFDGDRYCPRGHPDATKINEVKTPQRHAINHQDFAVHAVIFLEQVT
jgi:hypothetical protein